MLFSQNTFTTNPAVVNQQNLALKKAVFYISALLLMGLILLVPEFAHAGGFDKANNGLLKMLEDWKPAIHTFAILMLVGSAAGWMAGFVDKTKFAYIAGGLLIIGAAPDLVDMFWSN